MPRLAAFLLAASATLVASHAQAKPDAERDFRALADRYVAKYKPLYLESQAAWWEANITGTDAAYAHKKTVEKAIVDLHSDPNTFARLKALREQDAVRDPVLRRELDELYRTFLAGQADPQLQKQIVDLESDVEQVFNTFRSRVGDKTLTENDVRDILANSTDSAAVEVAWKGYMEVGAQAAPKLAQLVRLRNEEARQLGFKNFFSMELTLQEIDEAKLLTLFDELDALTRAPFAKLKAEMDAARAARFHVKVEELRPWHFGDLFFQEAPQAPGTNLDELFKDADLVALARKYYAGIGLPADDILDHSDLYEKPGKCPHAFCCDLDHAGDARVLANMKPNLYWADTILHELGHGVYDKYIRADVPFVLHDAAHAITTEGMALMFGAMVKNEDWLTKVLGVPPEQAARVGQAARESLRTERLMFSPWAQVMLRFEQGMYSDPNQDLGKLWWDLKRRYQLLNPPEPASRPDYAAKVHILTNPVYYHSYMMGELFASQVRHFIAHEMLKSDAARGSCYFGHPEVGTYLRDQVFGPGDLYSWNELTKSATGEPLTAKSFAEEIAP